MINLPSNMHSEDVEQWLNNSWFVVIHNDEEHVAEYRGVDNSQVFVKTLAGKRIVVDRSKVMAHWPMCGAVNVDELAVYVTRQQRRQYRRTYNSGQVSISVPRKWQAMKKYGNKVSSFHGDNPAVVGALFNPEYPSYEEALQDIMDGTAFSRAINPSVIITKNKGGMLVYYRGRVEGIIKNDKLVPVNTNSTVCKRILKHFNGRITL